MCGQPWFEMSSEDQDVLTAVDSCLQVQLTADLAAEWCYALNQKTPNDYTAKSNMEVWWQTGKRGEWMEGINTRFYS